MLWWACDYLSLLWLKLNHVSKRGPCRERIHSNLVSTVSDNGCSKGPSSCCWVVLFMELPVLSSITYQDGQIFTFYINNLHHALFLWNRDIWIVIVVFSKTTYLSTRRRWEDGNEQPRADLAHGGHVCKQRTWKDGCERHNADISPWCPMYWQK